MAVATDPVANRAAKSDAIVHSASRRRLIVAGPGAGKSYTFGRALAAVGGGGLALTFIRSLVADLRRDLGDLAAVDTFHGYCKGRLHAAGGAGLGADFLMYPSLLDLIDTDLKSLGFDCGPHSLQERFDEMDDADGLVSRALDLGRYYGAVSFPDSVYRLSRYFDDHPEVIPTYPLIVVDEYQDFNKLETRLIEQLAAKSPVLIAGDDDQALYDGKHADPRFIRTIAADGSFDVFDLPYCSRCTHVIVAGVTRVITLASVAHLLDGRLDKTFLPFPSKQVDSDLHPRIVHADCSVQRKDLQYMSRYVEQQIEAIIPADIEASYRERHPTVLVIGPSYFVSQVADYLGGRGLQVEFRLSSPPAIDIAEGYRLVAAGNHPRLGWRIIHALAPCTQLESRIADLLRADGDLVDGFCDGCRTDHLRYVALVKPLMDGSGISAADEVALRGRLNEPGDLKTRIAGWIEEDGSPAFDESKPRIVCTSLTGSKGLSAQHVFVVGMNNGDFPRDATNIQPIEVRQFIVALSRTRKACHLVSCRRFGGTQRRPSAFIGWIDDLVERRRVDKSYW